MGAGEGGTRLTPHTYMYPGMVLRAFIIIRNYNNSKIISVVKHTGEDKDNLTQYICRCVNISQQQHPLSNNVFLLHFFFFFFGSFVLCLLFCLLFFLCSFLTIFVCFFFFPTGVFVFLGGRDWSFLYFLFIFNHGCMTPLLSLPLFSFYLSFLFFSFFFFNCCCGLFFLCLFAFLFVCCFFFLGIVLFLFPTFLGSLFFVGFIFLFHFVWLLSGLFLFLLFFSSGVLVFCVLYPLHVFLFVFSTSVA